MRIFLCVLLNCLLVSLAHATLQDQYPFTNMHDSQRFQALTQEVRCVVCQNQNIADSNAPLASDLRKKIYQMVLSKQSDTAIKNYLVKRYGEFILLEPRLTGFTILLWFFPLLGFAFFGYVLVKVSSRT